MATRRFCLSFPSLPATAAVWPRDSLPCSSFSYTPLLPLSEGSYPYSAGESLSSLGNCETLCPCRTCPFSTWVMGTPVSFN